MTDKIAPEKPITFEDFLKFMEEIPSRIPVPPLEPPSLKRIPIHKSEAAAAAWYEQLGEISIKENKEEE